MIDLVYPPVTAPLLYGCTFSSAAEMLPVIDETGLVYAQAPRPKLHCGPAPIQPDCQSPVLTVPSRTSVPLHPVVHLIVVGRDGRLLLQHRSMSRTVCPGYWDSSVGGHVVYGEYAVEALRRESSEELGLVGFNPVCIDTFIYKTDREWELVNCFATVGSFDITPDRGEVSDVRKWNLDQINDSLGKGVFTPSFEFEFGRIGGKLHALL